MLSWQSTSDFDKNFPPVTDILHLHVNHGPENIIFSRKMRMSADLHNQSENVRQLLIDKLHDWKDGVSPAWNSTWPVFDRLITRHHEMFAV